MTVTNTVVFDFNFRTQHQGLKKEERGSTNIACADKGSARRTARTYDEAYLLPAFYLLEEV